MTPSDTDNKPASKQILAAEAKIIKIHHTEFAVAMSNKAPFPSVEFVVYEVVAWNMDETVRYYERKGAKDSSDHVTDTNEAAMHLKGTIKWDGCSDITFFPDDDGDYHACGRRNATNIGTLIDQLYGMAKDMMGPEFVHNLSLFEGK